VPALYCARVRLEISPADFFSAPRFEKPFGKPDKPVGFPVIGPGR
jgi:hypothetical protein